MNKKFLLWMLLITISQHINCSLYKFGSFKKAALMQKASRNIASSFTFNKAKQLPIRYFSENKDQSKKITQKYEDNLNQNHSRLHGKTLKDNLTKFLAVLAIGMCVKTFYDVAHKNRLAAKALLELKILEMEYEEDNRRFEEAERSGNPENVKKAWQEYFDRESKR